MTTEAGALFDNHPRSKNKVLLLDNTIGNSYASSNLENEARHAGKHLADTVEQKQNKFRGPFPATYSLFTFAMSKCGEVGSDVHAFIKELTIRRVEHRLKIHSDKSQHLTEKTGVASFGGNSLLFYRRPFHSAYVIISADRGWRLRAPDSSVRKARCLYTRLVPRE